MTFAPGAKASAHVRALLDKWKMVLPKLGHFKTGEPGRHTGLVVLGNFLNECRGCLGLLLVSDMLTLSFACLWGNENYI